METEKKVASRRVCALRRSHTPLDGGLAALCREIARMDNAAMLSWNMATAAEHLAATDPRFEDIIDRIGPCRMKIHPVTRPFPSLLHAIVYQQLSGKAAATIWGRVVALFPRRNPTPDVLLGLTDEQLRAAGMSRGKVLAARDLAAKVLDGTVPKLAQLKRMDDDEIKARLTAVRGIGPWSAEMFLMFRLGRPDVLPVGDLAIRKGFQIGWNKRKPPAPDALAKYGRRWAPYRTAASWYLWAIVDEDGGGW